MANSLSPASPPRNQESQKLKPEGLRFHSEEGPWQQMPVKPGKSSQDVEEWMGDTRPWVFSARVGSEESNSPGQESPSTWRAGAGKPFLSKLSWSLEDR